jgi:hypothetical protein
VIEEERIDILFAALGFLFNEKFTGRFPTNDILSAGKAYWREQLKDLTDAQIIEGLRACRNWKENMAPNLNEFRRLCLPNTEPKPPSPQLYVSLPKPPLSEKKIREAEAHITNLRKVIAASKSKMKVR